MDVAVAVGMDGGTAVDADADVDVDDADMDAVVDGSDVVVDVAAEEERIEEEHSLDVTCTCDSMMRIMQI